MFRLVCNNAGLSLRPAVARQRHRAPAITYLIKANLGGARLNSAHLAGAILNAAMLWRLNLGGANLGSSFLGTP
jgi:uncharacterized protein YjbI with pentapeptide repeats